MDDRWNTEKIGYRSNDLADQAEHTELLKRFRDQEVRTRMNDLLYNPASVKPEKKPVSK